MCDSYGRFNSVYQTHLYASVPPQAVHEGLASLAHLFCYMHHHLVYERSMQRRNSHSLCIVCCWNGKETPYERPGVRRVAYSPGQHRSTSRRTIVVRSQTIACQYPDGRNCGNCEIVLPEPVFRSQPRSRETVHSNPKRIVRDMLVQ